VSRLAVFALCCLILGGCTGGDNELANETCSWSGAGDAQNSERAHVCAGGTGDPVTVRAYHFKPGSRLIIKTTPNPIEVTIGEDGTARTHMPAGLGVVPVEGVKDDGTAFRNGLTSLRTH
jgi:hypothetical protein